MKLCHHAMRESAFILLMMFNVTGHAFASGSGGSGACCLPDGGGGTTCVTNLSVGDCHQMNGTYQGSGTSCDPDPCNSPDGACCIYDECDGPTCILTTEANCLAQQGSYVGHFMPCIPEACDAPTGACCTEEFEGFEICTIVTAAECNSMLGLYHGDNTTCSPDPCNESSFECGVADCCEQPPRFTDPAFAGFTGPVAVATKADFVGPDLRVVVVDIANKGSAPVNSVWPGANLYSDPSWNQTNLGAVFGLALDRNGNIYVAASSAYSLNQTSTAGPGGIYRIDGVTGSISSFTVTGAGGVGTNQLPNTLPALGNITYDCKHNQFFVTNMEDGKIYRLNSAGIVQSIFDHGTPDSGSPGFPPLGDRPWGIAVYKDRVYYGVWHEDDGRPNAASANEVWSVALGGGSLGNDFSGAAQLEITLPSLSGTTHSNPVADISFSTEGCMLLSERPMFSDDEPTAHSGRVLEYRFNGVAWVPSNNTFGVGVQVTPFNGLNAAGGNDYDIDGNVWATGDALQYGPQTVYGLQCLPGSGGTVSNAVLIDLDGDITFAEKSQIGDVDLPCKKCTPPPNDMAGWWPMDEQFGFTAKDLVAGNDGAHVNGVTPIAGKVQRGLQFDGVNDHVFVPDHGILDFAASSAGSPMSGDFSIDAWVMTCDDGSVQPIVDKRSASPLTGYALYLVNGAPALQLADGAATDYITATNIADGNWHHVAVTIDRDQSTGITFYVDGQVVPGTFDPTSRSGSLANNAALLIGSGHAIPTTTYFTGRIDEVEIFRRVLTSNEVFNIYFAQNAGKCKDRCHAPWDKPFCIGQSSRTVSVSICNDSNVDHTYSWSFGTVAGVGGSPGSTCNVNGPTTFTPASGSTFVASGQCVSIPVVVNRPSGFTGTSALVGCYDFFVTNTSTGHSFSCRGSVQQSTRYCPVILNNGPILTSPVNTSVPLVIEIQNTDDPVGVIDYSLVVMEPGGVGGGSPIAVSLDGLPPGEPIVRTVKIPPGEVSQVEIGVQTAFHDAFRLYDLLLLLDTDGDGSLEAVESISVASSFVDGACCNPDATCSDSETPWTCDQQGGSFAGEATECAVVLCETPAIPTASEWGLIVMAMLLLVSGTIVFGSTALRARPNV